MDRVYYYDTKIGRLAIAENGSSITHIEVNKLFSTEDFIIEETPLIKNAALQIEEYLMGQRKTFDLPLDPKGTPFQKSVWNALLKIPYGETQSYKDIAIAINNPQGYRAIGMANNKNPIMIVIPCHRVIGSNGSLVGYGGGLSIKECLLNIESKNKK